MSFLLRFLRIVAVLFWFLALGACAALFMRRSWGCIKKVTGVTRLWGLGFTKILNIKVKVFGDPSSFKGGIIVSNHMGYLDILVHGSLFPLRFTPKSDIASWPLLGSYVGLSHPIWIDRRSKQKSQEALISFRETMEHEIPLIVYPEGTSSDGKSGVLPFKSTPFEAVVSSNFPILPILTIYNEPDGRPTSCWYGGMTLLPHVWTILGFRSIEVEVHILPPVHPEGRSRKEIAIFVHDIIEAEYKRVHAERLRSAESAV
ncbi:MAG: hypothetical protein A2X49_00785 [Lentisphaerae bacterium GWF2_52_8]|nr:MAG: hypothetical protein A2X49_00785 [Lentisphaerae bacterium GWF2_52_8]